MHQPKNYNTIGWMPDNEALSLVSKNTKKGASILLYKLPAIIQWREKSNGGKPMEEIGSWHDGGKSNGGKLSKGWRKTLREENP